MSMLRRDPPPLARRAVLRGGFGLGLSVLAASPPGASGSSGTPARSMTPAGMAQDLPPDAGSYPAALYPRRTPFDLTDPRERALARLKVIVNLVGRKSYLSVMSRHFLCPPDQPPRAWVNELELFTMYLERLPQGDVQRSVFTRVFLDPGSLEPVREVRNPFSRQVVPVGDRLFALTLPVRLDPEAAVRNVTESDLPIVRLGEWIDFTGLAVREGEGFHQPSFDTSTWRVKYAELQKPGRGLIEAHYAFSSLLRGSLLSWAGMAADDPTQVMTTKSGFKVHDTARLPELVQRSIVARYPHRT